MVKYKILAVLMVFCLMTLQISCVVANDADYGLDGKEDVHSEQISAEAAEVLEIQKTVASQVYSVPTSESNVNQEMTTGAVSASPSNTQANEFKDVDGKYDWAKEAIGYFSSKGIIEGDGNGNFAPDANITREQFAKLIALLFHVPEYAGNEQTFSDVELSRWSYKYIEAVKQYLTGYYPNGVKPFYNPEGITTREDIAVALVKIIGLGPQDLTNANILENKFSDSQYISPELRSYVALAVEKNLMLGSDGKIRATEPITRAETVVLLMRTIKAPVLNDKNTAQEKDKISSPVTESEPTANNDVNSQMEYGDWPGNFQVGGSYIAKGEWMYSTFHPDKNESKYGIFKYKTNGEGVVQLYSGKATNIQVVGGWIYYKNSSDHRIYRIRTDGSQDMKVSDIEINLYLVAGDWIYCQNSKDYNKLYKIKTDGSYKACISGTLGTGGNYWLNVDNGWVYYTTSGSKSQEEDGLYKIDVNGTNEIKLTEDIACNVIVKDGWIYYRNASKYNQIFKMRTDGSEETRISDDSVSGQSMNVCGEWIYYGNKSDGESLYKVKIDGSQKGKVCSDSVSEIVVLGNTIVFWKTGQGWYILKPDGTSDIFNGTL